MSAPDPDFSLLRTSACVLLGVRTADEIPRLETVDWPRLLWLARKHRALLFLQHAVAINALAVACPAHIRAQLDALRSVVQLQGLARTREVCALHDALSAASVSFAFVDDWMFERCFVPDKVLVELTSPIRLFVAPAEVRHAQEALARTGHAEAAGQFQVAPRGHTPVELFPQAMAARVEPGLAIGGRLLGRLAAADWLNLLLADDAGRIGIDLLRAWQITLLDHLTRHENNRPAHVAPAVVHRCRALLGLEEPPVMSKALEPAPQPVIDALPCAPYVPTSDVVVERMLALAHVHSGDVVLDLGCGDGRVVLTAAKRFGASAIGIDSDPTLVAQARARAQAEDLQDRVTFVCDDLFTADIQGATVICLYLLPVFYEPVRKRLLRHARPGTRIVSHDYFFPAWPPEKTELVRDGAARMAQIFLWRVP